MNQEIGIKHREIDKGTESFLFDKVLERVSDGIFYLFIITSIPMVIYMLFSL